MYITGSSRVEKNTQRRGVVALSSVAYSELESGLVVPLVSPIISAASGAILSFYKRCAYVKESLSDGAGSILRRKGPLSDHSCEVEPHHKHSGQGVVVNGN